MPRPPSERAVYVVGLGWLGGGSAREHFGVIELVGDRSGDHAKGGSVRPLCIRFTKYHLTDLLIKDVPSIVRRANSEGNTV